MKTEEELRTDYRRQRQELEEQAEAIHRFQKKGKKSLSRLMKQYATRFDKTKKTVQTF
ncbi:hypothetical protein [Listeria aquatica]|uniref:hypothetical protein n=1 Tax=Listeria aquatica TaxID=1494960 RepID=UPI0031F5B56B